MLQRSFRTHRRGRRPRRPAVVGLPGWVIRTRSACPTAPTPPTVRPPPSTTPRIQSRGHSPRTISHGRTDVVLSPTPGGRGSPPLRWVERHPHLTHAAPTPQSRRFAPRQLPFQGSRVRWVQNGGVVRRPTVGCGAPTLPSTPQSRRRAPRQLPFQGSRWGCGAPTSSVVRGQLLFHFWRDSYGTPIQI